MDKNNIELTSKDTNEDSIIYLIIATIVDKSNDISDSSIDTLDVTELKLVRRTIREVIETCKMLDEDKNTIAFSVIPIY